MSQHLKLRETRAPHLGSQGVPPRGFSDTYFTKIDACAVGRTIDSTVSVSGPTPRRRDSCRRLSNFNAMKPRDAILDEPPRLRPALRSVRPRAHLEAAEEDVRADEGEAATVLPRERRLWKAMAGCGGQ